MTGFNYFWLRLRRCRIQLNLIKAGAGNYFFHIVESPKQFNPRDLFITSSEQKKFCEYLNLVPEINSFEVV